MKTTKKIAMIVALSLLNATAFAETWTWNGPQNATGSEFTNAGNWVNSSGEKGTGTIQDTANTTYVIGDDATIGIGNYSISMGNANLILGNNVSMGNNWAFSWKNITVGTNYKHTGTGDGFSLTPGSYIETNSAIAIAFKNQNAGIRVNLSTMGSIVCNGNRGINSGGDTNTIMATLNTSGTSGNGAYTLECRDLIIGDVWNREWLNYEMYDSNGNLMINMNSGRDITTNKPDWITNPESANLSEYVGQVYYVLNQGKGLSAYYVQSNPIPEPSTLTLGLVGLSTLLLRRRRQA